MKIKLSYLFFAFSIIVAIVVYKISNDSTGLEDLATQEVKSENGQKIETVYSNPKEIFNKVTYPYGLEITLEGTIRHINEIAKEGTSAAGQKVDYYVFEFDSPAGVATPMNYDGQYHMFDGNKTPYDEAARPDLKEIDINLANARKSKDVDDILGPYVDKKIILSGKLGVSPTLHYFRDIALFDAKVESRSKKIDENLLYSTSSGKYRTAMLEFTGPNTEIYVSNQKMWGLFFSGRRILGRNFLFNPCVKNK